MPQPVADIPWGQNMAFLERVKDPVERLWFDFLTLAEEAKERDLERGLLVYIRQFLLELGVGFAFAGSPYPLEAGGKDFSLDLLFYPLRLRYFGVIDLKRA